LFKELSCEEAIKGLLRDIVCFEEMECLLMFESIFMVRVGISDNEWEAEQVNQLAVYPESCEVVSMGIFPIITAILARKCMELMGKCVY